MLIYQRCGDLDSKIANYDKLKDRFCYVHTAVSAFYNEGWTF
jgi:hypothetical protein